MIEKLGQNLNWHDASLRSFPPLAEDELHIWWLPLTLDATQSDAALALLSDIQRDKYHRRLNEQLKQHYLAGRFYLLHLLGAYTNQAPHDVLLSYSRLNKPSLSDESFGVEFNFTDTQGHGVFAFCKQRHVGIDIESLQRKIDFESIAERRFTEQELAFVYQDGKLNPQRCLSIWTRKEAFGKATGLGINFQMNQQNLYQGLPSRNNPTKINHQYSFRDDDGTPWNCLQLELGEHFIASVVHEHHQELTLKAFKSLQI